MDLKPEELELILKALYRLLYPDIPDQSPASKEDLIELIGKLEVEYSNS